MNNAPCYLKNKFPRFRNPLYNQTSVNTFHGLRCKSARYMNSFFPGGINSWNYAISHFDCIPSIDILKKHTLSLISPGLQYLFQLRVGVSPLRYHKKRHNFIDTPSTKTLIWSPNKGFSITYTNLPVSERKSCMVGDGLFFSFFGACKYRRIKILFNI